MKTILLIAILISSHLHGADPKPVVDLSKILGFPPAGLSEKWGKPYLTDLPNNTADWEIGGWLITVKTDGKNIVWINAQASAKETPTPKDFPDALKMFGLTKEAGWTLGKVTKKGITLEAFLTHMEPGVFTVRSLPDKDRGMTSLVFKHTQFKYP